MGNFPLDVPAVDLGTDGAGRLAEGLALLLRHLLTLSHGDCPALLSFYQPAVEVGNLDHRLPGHISALTTLCSPATRDNNIINLISNI